ncbi:alpha-1,2-fucosyltransferase [Pontimonas sp.]|nr:alpha-1,2-fucosyltransferase [Pontimonas sp.]
METMLLMSEAAALVIGNSTFSWWAAYMGQAEKRPVIYPRPWLAREDFDDRDLFYPEWIGLGRE